MARSEVKGQPSFTNGIRKVFLVGIFPGWLEQVRREVAADHRNHLRRIEWLVPGVVWAMDVTEYDLGVAGKTPFAEYAGFGIAV